MTETSLKKDIVRVMLNRGVVLDSSFLLKLNQLSNFTDFHSYFMEKAKKETKLSKNIINEYLTEDTRSKITHGTVNIITTYEKESKKREVKDFVSYYSNRFNRLKRILQNRKELANVTSINRLKNHNNEDVSIIGLVHNKHLTKNGHIILEIEDPTGTLKVICSASKTEIMELATETVLDEVIGVVGKLGDGVIFSNNILRPDIPLHKEFKKAPEEVYAVFTSDLHLGNKLFLKEEFEKFISWLRGEVGSDEQRELVKKIKYVVMVGDIVEGIGIHPSQEKDLEIKDIYEQYEAFAQHIKKIPPYIKIIISSGNHDAMRIAKPQPAIYEDYAPSLHKNPNVILVSSPSLVNIHKSENFEGFDILMYHGFSFIHYGDQVESIREKGGITRADLIMKFLLQRRHLAPTHGSTLYLPDGDKDSLVIDTVPDIFVSGHTHCAIANHYRNITIINSSCWTRENEFQAKVGLKPQPGRVAIMNLQTRKVKMMKFFDEDK